MRQNIEILYYAHQEDRQHGRQGIDSFSVDYLLEEPQTRAEYFC
jgi:hypothetical protein